MQGVENAEASELLPKAQAPPDRYSRSPRL
jgi:hypothetical protein